MGLKSAFVLDRVLQAQALGETEGEREREEMILTDIKKISQEDECD